jgi:hypothetical protein
MMGRNRRWCRTTILQQRLKEDYMTGLLKTAGVATGALLLAMLAAPCGFADARAPEDADRFERQEDGRPAHARGLVGSWEVEVTIRQCQSGAPIRTFHSLGTYMTGGTMIDSTSGTAQELKTPGQGEWRHLGGPTYEFGFKSFTFDPAGNFTGWTKIVHVATMDPSGESYSSAGSLEVYSPNGILVFTGCASTTATRYQY